MSKDSAINAQKLDELITNGTRIRGKIIFLVRTKGYGFISSHEVPYTRIFFHFVTLDPVKAKHFTELKVKDEVEFELMEDKQGRLQATKIHSVEK